MGTEVDSPCGPGAPCRARLAAIEVAHQKALQELQEKHKREMRVLEEQRDMMLQEKSQAAAKGMLVTATERYSLTLIMQGRSLFLISVFL